MSEKTFAEKLKDLENITRKLENGDCSLEEAMNLYETGKKLASELGEVIKDAKQKIEVVE